MNNVKIPFAKDRASDQFVAVDEVEKGQACNCICPSCDEPLIARQGSVNIWHFSHYLTTTKDNDFATKPCDYSFEHSVRLMILQLFEELRSFTVPELKADHRIVAKEKMLNLDDVELRCDFEGQLVDIKSSVQGVPLIIYIVHKGRRLPMSLLHPKLGRCDVIQLSIESLYREFERRNKPFREIVINYLKHETAGKKWVYHAKQYLPELVERNVTQRPSIFYQFNCLECNSSWSGYQNDDMCKTCKSPLYVYREAKQ